MTSVPKLDLLNAEVAKMRAQVAAWFGGCVFKLLCEANDAGISTDEIAVLGWVDFNAPWARTKDNCVALCKGLAQINESNPKMCGTMLIMPDLAKDSSPRGLYDEERQILEELFALAQHCECRWIEMFARETKKAETKSNSRKFGAGRFVTSSAALDENVWLETELAMFGRCVGANELVEGAPLAVLPKTSSLLIPEPASPEFWQLKVEISLSALAV